MLDYQNVELASEALPDTILWSRENNQVGWCVYLGDFWDKNVEHEDMLAYASTTHSGDLGGLPPTHISVGDIDLFYSENC